MTSVLTFEPFERTEGSSLALVDDKSMPGAHQSKPLRPLPGPSRRSLVGDAARDQAFRRALAELPGYLRLAKNWDGYGGLPASELAAQFASDLLVLLQGMPEIAAPTVSPISTGVFLEWRAADLVLYFEAAEDSILFVLKKGNRVLEEGEDCQFNLDQAVNLVKQFHNIMD